MYFDGRYKLCMYHDAGTGELFDQHLDPHEFNDLWDEPGSQDLRHELMEKHFNAMMLRSGMGPPRLADF
jgi:hypothetical protein